MNNNNNNENQYVLLIGCTGFLGICVIHNLLVNTNYNLFLVIRNKNGQTVEERLSFILSKLNIQNTIV